MKERLWRILMYFIKNISVFKNSNSYHSWRDWAARAEVSQWAGLQPGDVELGLLQANQGRPQTPCADWAQVVVGQTQTISDIQKLKIRKIETRGEGCEKDYSTWIRGWKPLLNTSPTSIKYELSIINKLKYILWN